MKSLNVNMNYVSCFLLCVILILMVVCCCKKPTESFAEWKCTKNLPRWLGGACQSYSCLSAKTPDYRKWRSCGDNSNSYCTRRRQRIGRDRRKRERECKKAPAYIPAPSPQAVAVAAAAAAASSDPVVSLGNFLKLISEAELPAKEDTTVNIFWRCIAERKSCDFGTNKQKEAKWIITTKDAPNKDDVDLVEDFYEYLVDGWQDEFSVYTGNSIFKSPTFPTKIRNQSWLPNVGAGAGNPTPPTTEQKIIIQQMNTYKGLVESGYRFKATPSPTKDIFGNLGR